MTYMSAKDQEIIELKEMILFLKEQLEIEIDHAHEYMGTKASEHSNYLPPHPHQ